MGRKIRFWIISLSLLFMAYGCSAKWHLKKAIKKDPTLVQIDTIEWRDTIYSQTNRVEVDTVFHTSKDTVIIIKDNLTIKHWIHNDSVFITGSCDTIFMEIPYAVKIPVEKVVYNESWMPKWIWTLLLMATAIFIGKYAYSKVFDK